MFVVVLRHHVPAPGYSTMRIRGTPYPMDRALTFWTFEVL